MDKLNLMPKLTEQVLANIEHINEVEAKVEAHYHMDRVLADLGIRVVGQVDSKEDLPSVNDYPGTYGDGYAVGIAPPYDYYIYTRPFAGETENQWFDIGLLAIRGEPGEKGDKGDKGDTGATGQSTRWYSGVGSPYITASEGDQYLDTSSGDIYQFNNNWNKTGNIKGTPGAQGPRGLQGLQGPIGPRGIDGPRGEAGYSVVIAGILSSADMLPDPSIVDRHTAYVVEGEGQRWLYFITGDTLNLIWERVPFSAGTAVMSNGYILGTFNADSKVDSVNEPYILYGTDLNGNETTYPVDTGEPGSILIRDNNKSIIVPDPEGELEVANKQYVDNAIANADYVKHSNVEVTSTCAYGRTESGEDVLVPIGETSNGWLPMYNTNGNLVVKQKPLAYNEVTNKMYVDQCARPVVAGAAQRTIGAFLSNVGYDTLPSGKTIRMTVEPLRLSANNIGNQQGIGLSSATKIYRKIEITIINGSATAIGYKYNGGLEYLGAVTISSLIYALNASMGMYCEIKEA